MIPTTSANENPRSTGPPNSNSDSAVRNVKPDVRIVRLSVWLMLVLTSFGSDSALASASDSREYDRRRRSCRSSNSRPGSAAPRPPSAIISLFEDREQTDRDQACRGTPRSPPPHRRSTRTGTRCRPAFRPARKRRRRWPAGAARRRSSDRRLRRCGSRTAQRSASCFRRGMTCGVTPARPVTRRSCEANRSAAAYRGNVRIAVADSCNCCSDKDTPACCSGTRSRSTDRLRTGVVEIQLAACCLSERRRERLDNSCARTVLLLRLAATRSR